MSGEHNFVCGGSRPHPVDDRVIEVTREMQPLVEKKLNTSFSMFTPVSCLSQVVAGLNYFIKVQTDKGTYHLRVYDRFGDLSLTDAKQVPDDKEIEYFFTICGTNITITT